MGLLHWPSHSKALAANVLFQYADGSIQEWKFVLDWWFDRYNEGRGAIFSTIPIANLINRGEGKRSRLPAFFKYALRSLRELPIVPVSPGRFIDSEEARAEPFWTSPRFKVSDTSHADQWRFELTLNRIRDFIDPSTNRPWTDDIMRLFIREAFPDTSGSNVSIFSHRDLFGRKIYNRVPIRRLTSQWHTFLRDAGSTALHQASGGNLLPGNYSDASIHMMEKMGAQLGKGIGKNLQGRLEPPIAIGQTTKAGLGKAPRLSSQPKSDRPILMGLERDGTTRFGWPGERNGQIVLELSSFDGACNARTGSLLPVPDPTEMRPALLWRGGPVGIADATFPHPKGWTFEGFEKITLDKANVRTLTAIYRSRVTKKPPCESKWRETLGLEYDISRIWHRLCRPSMTPRDFKNYYRYLMRSMLTRNLQQGRPTAANPRAPPSVMCRMCASTPERFSHIQSCDAVWDTFKPLQLLSTALGVDCQLDQAFIVLGTARDGFLQGTLSDLHVILWKFVIIQMVAVDENSQKYDPAEVWKSAVRRQRGRLEAHAGRVQLQLIRKGPAPRAQMDSWTAQVLPLVAGYEENGQQVQSDPWLRTLRTLDLIN